MRQIPYLLSGKDIIHDLPVSDELPLPADWPGSALKCLGTFSPSHTDTLHRVFTGSTTRNENHWKTV